MLAQNAARPFEWGKWDCCIGLAAETGKAVRADEKDFARGWRGTYRTQTGAFRQLKKKGGVNTAPEWITKLLGDPVAPAFARTGDLVSYQGCIGVMVGGEGVFIGCEMMGGDYAREGLVNVPRRELTEAWYV